ncbi:MAG: undecaprenyl/decaprenyl-phosphate alpha-N-acetylglucosaminyl 1-phosphate transferase [Treponema sp.]|nr:undecaprenyl/decaprenyl-phosphate alpha-N-acetylglucosaminyl 1-phosphate transferase [Treponema sp.]
MTGILMAFSSSFFLSLIAVALVLRLSNKRAWFDHVDERKIHTGDIPRLGGIGFAIAFILVAAVINFSITGGGYLFLPCLFALLLTLVFGVCDDFRPIAPNYKLILQILAALCVIIPGYTFKRIIYIDDAGFLSDLKWLGIPLTFLWFVGLTNAMNLIDGIDGLAAGLAMIISVFFGLIIYTSGKNSQLVLYCISIFGAVLGFFIFNAPFPRARIFMGDGGSQFLGFSLALLPLLEDADSRAALPVLYAAALLAIPIFDTTAAVWRRVRDGKRINSPDKAHLHHKLLHLGLSVRGVNAVIYSMQILLGILTFISIRTDGWRSLIILGATYLAAISFFAVVHFMNRAANKKESPDSQLLR